MSVEENKAIVKRLVDEIPKGNLDAVREMHTPDYVHHLHDRDKNFDDFFKSYDEGWQITIEDIMADGDRVAAWMTWSSKERVLRGSIIYRISGGKIAETWNMTNIQAPPKA